MVEQEQKKDDIVEEEKFGTIEDILGAEDRSPVPIIIDEWGGKGTRFFIRQMSGLEGVELAEIMGDGMKKGTNVKVIIFGLCDKQGRRIFNDAHESALKRKSLKVLNRVSMQILRVNGLLREAAMVEEAERKND